MEQDLPQTKYDPNLFCRFCVIERLKPKHPTSKHQNIHIHNISRIEGWN